jgi:hypothetical protein
MEPDTGEKKEQTPAQRTISLYSFVIKDRMGLVVQHFARGNRIVSILIWQLGLFLWESWSVERR